MTPTSERPLGDLFTELAGQTSSLVRLELGVARAELVEKASLATRHAAGAAAGVAMMQAAALTLAAAAVLGLDQWMPMWMSALIVGITLLIAGAILARTELEALRGVDPVPRATVRTLEEGRQWAKKEMSR